MISRHESRVRRKSLALSLVTLLFPVGCSGSLQDEPDGPPGKQVGTEKGPNTQLASANNLLSSGDYPAFRPDRSRDEILKDIQWRGNLEMAAPREGKPIRAISYGIHGGPYHEGRELWAIFEDDRFKRFVEPPDWGESPIKVGDFQRLFRAAESKPVRPSDVEKEIRAEAKPKAHVDPGLTAAFLLTRSLLEVRMSRDHKRNAELRDHFNASRLNLGMTPGQVRSILRSEPLESGEVKAGGYEVYGSTEAVDILEDLHYSNILVLYQGGKVGGIYSGYTIPGEERGLRSLHEPVMFQGVEVQIFSDLPPLSKPKPK